MGLDATDPQAHCFRVMLSPALSPEHVLQLAFPSTGRLPSVISAADFSRLVRCFIGTTQPSDSSSVPRQLRLLDFLSRPGIDQRLRAKRGLPGSDAILPFVMWPQTPAGRRFLA